MRITGEFFDSRPCFSSLELAKLTEIRRGVLTHPGTPTIRADSK
jgi:hypothetical protein